MSDDGSYLYYYDCENRLTDVNNQGDQPVASYKYDYQGRRLRKVVYGEPNIVTQYAYDGDQVIAEYDESDNLLRKFVYGPGIDEPICMIDVADNNAVYYYHFDGLGSVIALSNENSEIIERYSCDVFGEPNRASDVNNPYLFTGRRYDPEAGLYYYRARYYDYYTGRFLQPDPIGDDDGLNLYSYVGNNPTSLRDPFGLLAETTQPRSWNRDKNPVIIVRGKKDIFSRRYRISTATDLVMILIEAKVTGNRIESFRYIGHGWTEGLGLSVAPNTGIVSSHNERIEADNRCFYSIDSLVPLMREAFDSHALIRLEGCFTAFGSQSIGADFKRILPEAQVWGYSGNATISTRFEISFASLSKESDWIELTPNKKRCQ